MNKIYRLVWSERHGKFVVTHEKNTGHGKARGGHCAVVGAVVSALLTLCANQVLAACTTDTAYTSQSVPLCFTTSFTVGSGQTVAGTIDDAFAFSGDVASGALVNNGTITSIPGAGIFVDGASSTVAGGITNSGLIQSNNTGSDGAGIYVYSDGVLGNASTGTAVLNNAGATISGAYSGIYAESGIFKRGITNAGLITGSNYGIWLSGSTVSGAIINQVGGTISGGSYGIYLKYSSTQVTDGITNSGTISGSSYSIYDRNSVLSKVVIAGDNTARFIGGVNATNADMSIASGATYTLRNDDLFDVKTFTNNGTALFDAAQTNQNFTLKKVDDYTFVNNGKLEVLAGKTGTLSGDVAWMPGGAAIYTQAAGGIFRTGVGTGGMAGGTFTGTYGKLYVDGNIDLATNTTIDVNVLDEKNLPGPKGATVLIPDVMKAGLALKFDGVANGAGGTASGSKIRVTDNSYMYDFTASTARDPEHAVDLIMTQINDPAQTAIAPLAAEGGCLPCSGVAKSLDSILAGSPASADWQQVTAALGTISTAKGFSDAVRTLMPVHTGGGTAATTNSLHSLNRIIQSRIEGTQGLSSGDETFADKQAWVKPFGAWGEQANRDSVNGFNMRASGLAFGADAGVNDRLRLGGVVAYAAADVTSKGDARQNTKVDIYELVGYGSYNLDPITDINFQIDVGYNKNRSTRQINLGGLSRTANGDYDSWAAHGSLGIGRVYVHSETTNFTPSVRLDYLKVWTDGYTEKNAGVLNLNVAKSRYEEFLLSGDIKVSHALSDSTKLVGNLAAAYDFINRRAQTTAAFIGDGPAFVTEGMKASPWLYRAGLGLINDDKKGTEYSLRYDAEARTSGYLNQSISARLRWAF